MGTPLAAAAQDSRSLFQDVFAVLTGPRCVNCHTTFDEPRQGDANRRHTPPARRGDDGRGTAGLRCTSCHRATNNPSNSTPGAPDWRMPPASMGWSDLTPRAVCEALHASIRAANVPVGALIAHVQRDPLILWAWEPGGRRTPPPVPHADFVSSVEKWVAAGAACPD
jgi:hypothetical protein